MTHTDKADDRHIRELVGQQSEDHKVNGLVVYPVVVQEVVDKLTDFQLYSDDVWVVSYPKTGNTWTRQIVKLLRNNGVEDGKTISHTNPWLEGLAIYPEVDVDKLPRPRAFKSHFPYNLCPCGPPNTTPCKYIYVMRNPKDVAVSLYFFNKRFELLPNENWDMFWEKYVGGKAYYHASARHFNTRSV